MERVTLTQAARALGVPQHRLIHLCEKRVVVPDLHDARGRGSSRGFSRRNLFEFAVALELRRLELPVAIVRAVLAVLRSFEQAAQGLVPQFLLPDSLVGPAGLEASVLLIDGSRLYFTISKGRANRTVLGGVEIPQRGNRPRVKPRRVSPLEAQQVIESAKTRAEVNLTRIARALPPPLA
jgi:hypothetical protein